MKSIVTLSMKWPGTALFRMIVLVAVVDIIMIFASGHVAVADATRVTTQLNLGRENNLAVWWSSSTLLLAGLLLFESSFRHTDQRIALRILSALLVFLSLDEMGSLHERIFSGSYWSYVPYALAGGVSFLYAVWQLYRQPDLRRASVIIFIGFSCYGGVVVQEFLEHNVDWPMWALGLRVGLEEGSELLGTALVLVAAGKLLGFDKSRSLALPVIHRPSRSWILGVMSVIIVAEVYTAFVAPDLTGYTAFGNPALWFAMATFFCLAYYTIRSHNLAATTHWQFFITSAALFGSLAQSMVQFNQRDLLYLAGLDCMVFATIIALIWISRRNRTRLVTAPWVITSFAFIVTLAFFAFNGSATAVFLLSFAVAALLLAYTVATVTCDHSNRHRNLESP